MPHTAQTAASAEAGAAPETSDVPADGAGDRDAAAAADPPRLADIARYAAINAERQAIEITLKKVHWNRRKAAQILGVSYKTLLNKIKECGISRD